jgi:short-subunit dehydrogenase
LLVNAAGFFIPRAFSEYDEAFYDSYNELNRALFFITQTVVAGMVAGGQGGAVVNVGAMWAHQGIAATPHSGYSVQKGGLHSFTKLRRSRSSWRRTASGSTRSRPRS